MENTNTQIQTAEPTADIIDVAGASNKLKQMIEFVTAVMKKGNDYMSIQGGKPTLLKSGAEKMNILMGYAAEYEKQDSIMKAEDQYYYVEMKCSLRNKQGLKVAEGLGSCNNKETAKQNVPFYDSLNTVLKMAEKRAYVAATLNANALSQFYTQDLEDMAEPETKHIDANGAIMSCVNCGIDVTKKVALFSEDHFKGKILCMACQQKVKEAQ